MKSLVKQQKQYTFIGENYQLPLPIDFETAIAPDDSVRLLSHILEELNYSKLYQAYSHKGRKPGVEPRIMFKVIVYAFMEGIYSVRAIEKACKRDINFKWLLQGYPALDHSNIARFIKDYLSPCMEDLFYQLVYYLHHIDEVHFENLFVDGTKIEANANKYTFVWKKVIHKNEEKMHVKVAALFDQVHAHYLTDITFDRSCPYQSLAKLLDFLKAKASDEQVIFVQGIGKRKSLLQKLIEQTQDFMARQEKYDSSNQLFNGRNSYSKTDVDATFMHMKEDHMRNAQLKPGYNVQIGVESEYITGVDLYPERSDVTTLIPFLETMHDHLGIRYKNVIADAGYESEENYLYLEEKDQKPYIKPLMYEKWKKKSFKNDISKRENMTYDAVQDYYICAAGRKLNAQGLTHKTSANGYVSEVTRYECEDCNGCPYKEKCTKAKGNRKLYVSKKFIEKRDISYKNILTDKGIELRMNRSIQVEGAFGIIKWDHDFTRFLRRGKNNVKTEFLLLSFSYNIRKLHARIQAGRCGLTLHPLKKA